MRRLWAIIKFTYLYLSYWLVGLTEDDFYITKGDLFTELGKFSSAIAAYQKALKESQRPSVYWSIGWCYLLMFQGDKALEYYRKAYEKIKIPDVAIILASLEMGNGNREECRLVFGAIEEPRDQLDERYLEPYDEVKEYLSKPEDGVKQ